MIDEIIQVNIVSVLKAFSKDIDVKKMFSDGDYLIYTIKTAKGNYHMIDFERELPVKQEEYLNAVRESVTDSIRYRLLEGMRVSV